MTADCLPVLFCYRAGTAVAAAHAGWRGLAGGVLQNTIAAMKVPPVEMMAYLGPAISADAFEVGQDVFDAFCTPMPEAAAAFEGIGGGKFLADLYALARLILKREGVGGVYGGTHCTVLERDTFFS
ncbi:laccase domain-containing protein, partial [Klebsiella pneumoniae]|nr:laccase domain-containing protein [Klebsiella pneumoniae]